jgi:hypothetical protein
MRANVDSLPYAPPIHTTLAHSHFKCLFSYLPLFCTHLCRGLLNAGNFDVNDPTADFWLQIKFYVFQWTAS